MNRNYWRSFKLPKKKGANNGVRGILFLIGFPFLIAGIAILVSVGAGVGALIGAIALPLKILDGRIADAPQRIKDVFDVDRDSI